MFKAARESMGPKSILDLLWRELSLRGESRMRAVVVRGRIETVVLDMISQRPRSDLRRPSDARSDRD